eukprot:8264606-Alexandrium_andersonii.AAC.1
MGRVGLGRACGAEQHSRSAGPPTAHTLGPQLADARTSSPTPARVHERRRTRSWPTRVHCVDPSERSPARHSWLGGKSQAPGSAE